MAVPIRLGGTACYVYTKYITQKLNETMRTVQLLLASRWKISISLTIPLFQIIGISLELITKYDRLWDVLCWVVKIDKFQRTTLKEVDEKAHIVNSRLNFWMSRV